jgi:hypothetical protein
MAMNSLAFEIGVIESHDCKAAELAFEIDDIKQNSEVPPSSLTV